MGRPPKNITIDNVEQFKVDFVNPLFSEEDLSTKYKRSVHYVLKAGSDLGLRREKRRGCTRFAIDSLPIDVIIKYLDGASCRQLAKEYNCSFPTISAFLKEHDVVVKTNVETVTKYEVNKDYFKDIDTSEKAYFLGFICADGYITKKHQAVAITLKEDDVEVLEAFKKAVGYTGPIFDRLMRLTDTDIWVNRKSLIITNKVLVSHLLNLGVVNRKSLILQWPIIPEHLNGAMLLGLSDGDGSIYKSNAYWYWSLVGSDDIINTAKVKLMEQELGDNKIKKHCNIQQLTYGGYTNLKKIYAYMYENHSFCLQRKKDRFLICLSENERNEITEDTTVLEQNTKIGNS